MSPKPKNTTPASADSAHQAAKWFNRDLSWLEFNARVLHEAEDPRTPLLERVKFLAIFANNLDEFVMKRLGLFNARIAEAKASRRPPRLSEDGRTPEELLNLSRDRVVKLQQRQAECWDDDVRPALERVGIRVIRHHEMTPEERAHAERWFHTDVFPVLTPLAVDPGHRFPFISNLSENLAVRMFAPGQAEPRRARVKIPDVVARFVHFPPELKPDDGSIRLLPLEELLVHNLDDLFPGLTIDAVLPFRVTRSAVIEQDDDDIDDLLEHVETELRERRFAEVVRLETGPDPDPRLLDFVMRALELDPHDHFPRRGPLEWLDLFQLADLEPPQPEQLAEAPRIAASGLRAPRYNAITPPELDGDDTDVFARIREGDVLVHHPYESFKDSVERFIRQAAKDPDVLAIKQTIYRTSPDSPFVRAMVRAAERGKQVACMVELRARFDEHKNVRFARQLERAGVHVAYGVMGLKTHSKTALVLRKEPDGLRAYAHIGTGNYHPGTAQLYTDLSLLTCDPRLTADVTLLFNALTGHAMHASFDRLLVAPEHMRQRFEDLIDRETELARAGKHAHIAAKMNQLQDERIIERLYKASQAGVQIDLYIRGFCCLRPGVPGLSDNIRVVSTVGRFLEHSRIFHFSAGHKNPVDGEWYIGSGDWMVRNLDDRVEATTPVDHPQAKAKIAHILEMTARDHRHAWDLHPDGSYTQRTPPKDADPHSPEATGVFKSLMRHAKDA
ncbi:MAG: polyphosphate kinase 1 [Planctomycetota bacterium]